MRHPAQTSSRLAAALATIEKAPYTTYTVADALKVRFLVLQRFLARKDEHAMESVPPGGVLLFGLWRWLVPWEAARVDRLLKVATAVQLRDFQALTDRFKRDETCPYDSESCRHRSTSYDGLDRWLRTTVAVRHFVASEWWAKDPLYRRETRRRATRLRLALTAYRLQHGTLPNTLEDLVGDYFRCVPGDPYSGRSFSYWPTGLPVAFEIAEPEDFIAQPGQPILFSGGPNEEELVVVADNDSRRHCQVRGRNGLLAEADRWSSGQAFPIP